MKNIFVFMFLIALATGHECFSQTQGSITSTIGVGLIQVDDLFKVYNVRTLSNQEDTLRVLDSILMVIEQSRKVVMPTIEVGHSTIRDVQAVWGTPIKEVLVLNNENKKKWIYANMIVFFNNDIIEAIIKKPNHY
jgi:hypothetical protein